MSGDIQFGMRLTADASNLNAGVESGRQQVNAFTGDVKGLKTRLEELQNTAAGIKGQLGSAFDPNAASYFEKSLVSVNAQIAQTQAALASASSASQSGFKALTEGADKAAFATAGARRELIVLGHEALTGNFSRIPGSFLVLSERMGGLGAAMGPVIFGLVGIGVAAAALITVVARAEQSERAMNTLATRFDATGRSALGTRDSVALLVREVSELSGVDKAAGQEIVGAFANAHNIAAPMVKDLIGLVGDFATATGTKAPEAAKLLAAAFEDPVRGVQELQKVLGTLSVEQELQVQKAMRLGDVAGAQRVLFDALTTSVQGFHNQALTPLQRATEDFTHAWDDLTGSVSKSGAWSAITGYLADIISGFRWIIDHRNDIKTAMNAAGVSSDQSLLGAAARSVFNLSGQSAAIEFGGPAPEQIGATTGVPPHVAGDTADNTSASVSRADALQLEERALLKTAGAYHSLSEGTRQASEDAKAFESILAKMRAAGEQNTETYRRFSDALQGAREQMARKTGDFDNSVFLQGIKDQGDALRSQLQQEQQQRKASYQFQLGDIEAFHQAALIGEQAYRTAKAQALQGELQDEIANIDQAVTKQADILAQLYTHSAGSRQQEKANYQARIEAEKQFYKLLSERAVLVTNLSTAERASENAELIAAGRQQALIRSINDEYAKFLQSIDDEQKKRQLEVSLIGKTKEEQARANAEFAEEAKLQTELNKLWDEFYKAAEQFNGGAMSATLTKINDLNGRWATTVKTAGDAAATIVRTTQTLSDQVGVWNQLADAAGGFAAAMTHSVGSAFDFLRNQAKQLLADLVSLFAKRWVLNLGASLLEGTPAGLALADQASKLGGGTIAGAFGNPFGSGFSLLGNTFGGGGQFGADGAGIGFGSAGIGSTFGPLIGGAGIGAAIGAGSAALFGNGRNNTGMTIGGTVGGLAGSFFGPIGSIVGSAIGSAIGSLFQSGGGPKGGGSASTGNVSALSFGAGNGRFYTPNTADSSLSQVLGTENTNFGQAYSSLGGKGTPNVGFALGYDTDPNGTANNRVSAGATVNGKSVYQYYSGDNALGRSDAVLQSTLTLEAKRALLAALQNSDLPKDVLTILQSLDVGTASEKAIDDALNLAKAVKTLADFKLPDDVYQRLKGTLGPAGENQQEALTFGQAYSVAHNTSLDDPRAAATHAIATADAGAAGTLSNLIHGTADLMNSFDGTADAALGLANASVTLKQGLIDAMIQAEQVKKSLHDMFDTSRERITLAGMPDNQARYNYYRSDAETQRGLLASATDPEVIRSIGERINRDINSAFDLLSPEQQQAHFQEFLDGLNQADTETATRLSQYETSIQTTVDGMTADIKTIINSAMDTFIDGAGDVKDGGGKIAVAASNVQRAADALNGAISSLASALQPSTVTG